MATAAPTKTSKADAATKTYVVVEPPLTHDGETYDKGHEVELTDDQAESLAGVVKPKK